MIRKTLKYLIVIIENYVKNGNSTIHNVNNVTKSLNPLNDDEWHVNGRKKGSHSPKILNDINKHNAITIENRFNGMLIGVQLPSNREYENISNDNETSTSFSGESVSKRNKVMTRSEPVVNKFYYNDILIQERIL